MAALALTFAACSNDDNDIQSPVEQPAKAEGITITTTLAPKTNGATNRAVSEGTNEIVVEWAVNEHIAILYTKDATPYAADATITAVDGSGAATITFTVEAGTPDNTACTLVYPLSAAKDDHTGVKDAATLLADQDGTLSANLDVRVGAGTIQTTTPGLTVTTDPAAQFSIFKFTIQNISAAAKSATEFKVSDGSGNVITTVTPTDASGELYVALPVMAAGTYWFNATINSNPYIAKATVGTATTAGNYYQSTVKMATIGDVILSDGKFAARSSTGTKVAMIAYLGSETGEAAPCNHGLALALSDENSGNTCKWSTSKTKVHTYNTTNSNNFTSESGLQYNDATHNSDTYPAFKAAIANNSTAAPTGCSAWFLASGYQWNKMINACKNVLGTKNNYQDLRNGFNGISGASNLQSACYWSSTEYNDKRAWDLNFINGNWSDDKKDDAYTCRVRACLAF